MSEELIQRNLVEAPEKMGDWNFYNIGATTLKALKGAKIIPDRDYEEYEGKKPDALITKKPIVIAAIEYKTPVQLRTEKQVEKAIVQELGTAQALQARVYIVTDGKKTFWVNPATGNEIVQEDGSKITLNFDKNSTDCITLINKIRSSISATKGDNGEDEFTKLYPSMLADVMVPVPVDAEGNISLALQKEIATEYLAIQHYQQEAISLLELIIRQKVSL